MFQALLLWLDKRLNRQKHLREQEKDRRTDYGKTGAEITAEVRAVIEKREAEARVDKEQRGG